MAREYTTSKTLHTYEKINIEMVKGDNLTLVLDLDAIDENDQVVEVPLTGARIKFTTRKTAEGGTVVICKDTATGGIIITDPAHGVAEVYLAPADTENVTPGKFYYDIQVQLADGMVYTPVKGELVIVTDVTH